MTFITTTRLLWDVYAELATPQALANNPNQPTKAAQEAADFADEMGRQRIIRFHLKDKKKDE